MDVNDLHPSDDYSHRFFIWHEWIQANGPLTTENVFEYFATSMYYDRSSNNQVLRMQFLYAGEQFNEAEELKRFTGLEYALVHSQPPSFFIIHKRDRISPETVRPLAAYFIMNNRIYQAPDIYNVLSNRLLTSLQSLQTTLDTLRLHRPDYTPRTGFVWPIIDSSDTTGKKRPENDPTEIADTGDKANSIVKRHQNTMLLLNAMRATAAHSSTSSISSSNFAQILENIIPDDPPPADSKTVTPPVPQTQTSVKQETKGPPGGGKKKRKRTLQASPTTAQ